jgi:type VI protein secretion system component VasF
MTLIEACDPVFLKVCELNKMVRLGTPCPDYKSLRSEILVILGEVRKVMLADPSLERHWSKIELPLIFFVDSMISESHLPIATEWNRKRLAFERKELAGDQKFFDLLEENLQDPGIDATARLPVFFNCMGLGFMGYHANDFSVLQKMMDDIISRVDPTLGSDSRNKITPEAYDYLDIRNLIQAPPIRTSILVSIFIALFVFSLATMGYLLQRGTLHIRYDLKKILSHSLDTTEWNKEK